MFNSIVLDVFIGLVFIFLLYSLLATILQEIIAHRMNLRARMLQKAVRKMLEDHASPTGTWFQRSTFYNYFAEIWENVLRFFEPFRDHENFVKQFFDHPSIKYLGEDKAYSKPSYIQPHNFSNTLTQLLRGTDYDGSTKKEGDLIKNALDTNALNVTPETLGHLKNLFADARQDPYQFRERLQQWFDETMQRTNGWYKRQTQTFLVLIGFVIAMVFNVDTIAISKILSKDKNAREQLVQLAINKKDEYGKIIDTLKIRTTKKTIRYIRDTTAAKKDSVAHLKDSSIEIVDTTIYQPRDKYFDSAYHMLINDANSVQNILGLRCPDSALLSPDCQQRIRRIDSLLETVTDPALKKDLAESKKAIEQECKATCKNPYQTSFPLKLAGWLLTAWAISLGAPFWFDLLNKVVQLRSSGTKVPTGVTSATGTPASGTTADGKKIRG